MKKLADCKLYVISVPPKDGMTYPKMAELSALGGADIFQLRIKDIADREYLEIALEVREVCKKHEMLFVINDRVNMAFAIEADGVHLGQNDLSIDIARDFLGSKKIIGKSAHSLGQAEKAQAEGASYVLVGPVFEINGRPDYIPVGAGFISEVRSKLSIPVIPAGGIDLSNLDSVLASGARCVGFEHAIFGSEDIIENARKFKARL